jgi:hypothetical protein
VRGVRISARGEDLSIATPRFVNAAGPFVGRIGRLLGLDLPVFCERHAKVAFNDVLGAVPRWAPMTIWTDPITCRGPTRSGRSCWRPRSTSGSWRNSRQACTDDPRRR